MADNWQTPPDLVKVLRQEFNFTHEVCAAADNRCMPDLPYLGLDNGLDAMHNEWGPEGSVCYCNPPYSQLPDLVSRADQQAGNRDIILLIPAYTETKYFQDYIAHTAELIVFPKGRIRFWENGKPGKYHARFPSVLVHLSPWGRMLHHPHIGFGDWKAAAK